jgi:hypothetical protein
VIDESMLGIFLIPHKDSWLAEEDPGFTKPRTPVIGSSPQHQNHPFISLFLMLQEIPECCAGPGGILHYPCFLEGDLETSISIINARIIGSIIKINTKSDFDSPLWTAHSNEGKIKKIKIIKRIVPKINPDSIRIIPALFIINDSYPLGQLKFFH